MFIIYIYDMKHIHPTFKEETIPIQHSVNFYPFLLE